MTCILRVDNTTAINVSIAANTEIAPKGYPWTLRVLGDVPFFVLIDEVAEADNEDFYCNEFQDYLFAVGADDEVSIIGDDTGVVWASEVRCSS